MKRIDKLASTIAEEYGHDGRTDTLMKLIKSLWHCRICAYQLKEHIAYIDKKTGEVKTASCMLTIEYNSGDYSKGCEDGVEEYMNTKEEDNV